MELYNGSWEKKINQKADKCTLKNCHQSSTTRRPILEACYFHTLFINRDDDIHPFSMPSREVFPCDLGSQTASQRHTTFSYIFLDQLCVGASCKQPLGSYYLKNANNTPSAGCRCTTRQQNVVKCQTENPTQQTLDHRYIKSRFLSSLDFLQIFSPNRLQ